MSFIKTVKKAKFSAFLLNEKRKEDPDNFVDYIADFGFRLHKIVKESSGAKIEIRYFEIIKSRIQKAYFGQNIFIIHHKGIEISLAPFILTEILPPLKKIIVPEDENNESEYGLKINGVLNFYKYYHSKDRMMKPFWFKNSFTLLEGPSGALKTDFAKFIVKSSFRDETWLDKNNKRLEIDYRYMEVDKPELEILSILMNGGNPIDKKIGLYILFGENHAYNESEDIIWETYFGKVIIPACKNEEDEHKSFAQVSYIILQFRIASYHSNECLSIIDKFIKVIQLWNVFDFIPNSYLDFIGINQKKNENQYNKKLKEQLTKMPLYLYYSPFKHIYNPQYLKQKTFYNNAFKIIVNKDDETELEIRIVYNKKHYSDNQKNKNTFEPIDLNISKLEVFNKLKGLFGTTKKELFFIDLIDNCLEKLKCKIKSLYTSDIISNKDIDNLNKYIESDEPLAKNKSDLISLLQKIFYHIKANKKNTIQENNFFSNIDNMREVIFFLKFYFQIFLIYKDKDKENLLPILYFFLHVFYIEKNSKIKGINWVTFINELRFEVKKIKDDKEKTKKHIIIEKKIVNPSFSYIKAKYMKVSRIVLNDLERVINSYPLIRSENFLPVLNSLCLANSVSLFVVNSLISETKSKYDIQAEALANNIFYFDEIIYEGNLYYIMNIKKSYNQFHNNKSYEIHKRISGILEARPTFNLLINFEKHKPQLIKIRLFLNEGQNIPNSAIVSLFKNKNNAIEKIINNLKIGVINSKCAQFHLKEPTIETKDITTLDSKKNIQNTLNIDIESFKNPKKIYNEFLIESLKFNLGHPEIELSSNPQRFTNINIEIDNIFSKDSISIVMIQDYRMHVHRDKLRLITFFVKILNNSEDKIYINSNSINNPMKNIKLASDNKDNILIGVSEYYQDTLDGYINTSIKSPLKKTYINKNDLLNNDLPEILFPAIYRNKHYKIETWEKVYGNKEKMCHLTGIPYFMDPGVLLICLNKDNSLFNNILLKKKQLKLDLFSLLTKNDYHKKFRFIHRNADDLSAFLIELAIKQQNKFKNSNNYYCINDILNLGINNKNFKELLIKISKHFDISNEDDLIIKDNDLKNTNHNKKNKDNSDNDDIITFRREWYSTAIEKIRIFRQIYSDKRYRFIILPLSTYSVTINWYLGLFRGSSREEIGAKIISYMTSPENTTNLMQKGIGLPPYNEMYEFDEDFIFTEMSIKSKNLKDIVKNSVSLSKFPCYYKNASIIGKFFHDLLSSLKDLTESEYNIEIIYNFISKEFTGLLITICPLYKNPGFTKCPIIPDLELNKNK